MLDSAFGVTGDNINKVTKGFDLGKVGGVAKFGAYLGTQGTVQALAQTALQGGSLGDNLQTALTGQVQHLLQASVFKNVGDFADKASWAEGSPEKAALHAVVGGLLSEATGGDFKTGALAGGANELLVEQLAGVIKGDKSLELTVSQLIGVAAATATGGDPAKAAELAKNATAYNRHLHDYEKKQIEKEAKRLQEELGASKTGLPWDDLLLMASGAELDAAESARLQAVVGMYGENNPESQIFFEDMERAFGVISHLASQNTPLTWSDGKVITAHGEPVYAFQASQEQYLDSSLFNANWSSQQSTNYHASYTELVPQEWKEQFGTADANRYLREIAQAAATSPESFNGALERLATVANGGILPVTWDVDIALALAGGGGKLGAEATKNIVKWLSERTGAKATTQRLPTSLPESLTGYANPADIRFTQNSVSNTFKDGQSLQSTIDALKSGKISPDDLPPIRVFEKDGVVYSLDNRRLLAASQAGVPIKIVPATQVEVAKEAWKMTTPNGGTIICVRGSCQ